MDDKNKDSKIIETFKLKFEKVDIKENWRKYKLDLKENFNKYLQQISYSPTKPVKPEDLKTTIKKLIRTRKSRSLEAEIENVFIQTNCCNNRGEYPYYIAKNKKSDNCTQVMFKLPYGLNYKSIIDKKHFFSDSMIAHVNIENRRGLLMVEVIKGIIPEKYKYNFNYIEYMGDYIIPIPIGVSVGGEKVILDITEMIHVLIGGLPNSGKSILMTGWCDALLQNPNVKLFVIDLAMTDFIHLKNHVIFGYDLNTAEVILEFMIEELEKRRLFLVQNNCVNVIKYNEKNPNNKLDYIVLIIDEFAFTSPRRYDTKELKRLRQKLQGYVMDISMLSRKCGIHLIVAMQRPSRELIPMEIKSNFPTAISFKMVNNGTSMTILGNTDAVYLSSIKGRMIFQLGSKQMELQAMLLEQEEAIRRLRMFDKISNKIGDQFDPFLQFQEYEHTTKRLLPR